MIIKIIVASQLLQQYWMGSSIFDLKKSGADPGSFLGRGALVSCSTSTPINHIVFFVGRILAVLENRRSSQGKGGGVVRTPCTLPLDPPLEIKVEDFLKSLKPLKTCKTKGADGKPAQILKIEASPLPDIFAPVH